MNDPDPANRPMVPRTVNEPTFGPASDYSRIASRYDATRNLPPPMLDACYDRLIERNLLSVSGLILDAGCGTGQVSLPLVARGYHVTGIDISEAMTGLAQAKVQPGWRASYVVGDVRAIAAEDHRFDAVVVSKLFQHIHDWQDACRELIRVVRPGGSIVQINERGAFSNAVRRFFSKRADEYGFPHRYEGLNPRGGSELSDFMGSQGCEAVPIDTADLTWELTISYGEAFRRIQEGLFAEFWRLPAAVHDRLLAETWLWIEAQPERADTVDRLRPYLAVDVFRTPGRP